MKNTTSSLAVGLWDRLVGAGVRSACVAGWALLGAIGLAQAGTATTTTLAVAPNPAFVAQNVTLTATVSNSSATGTMTFKDGTTTLGTATVSAGKASLTKTFSTAGSHSVTASYGGDATRNASTSSAVSLKINAKSNTTTALVAAPSTAYISQSVTLTATITGSSPSGTVTFKDGSTSLGSATISAGKATLTKTFATAGAHSLTATYGGDTGNNGSTSSAVTETINAKGATTTALSVSPSPALNGASVTLKATVSGTSPTGTVTFKDGTTSLGTATLSSGVATLTKTFTVSGSHSLTAVYAGDSANSGSTSSVVNESIQDASSVSLSPDLGRVPVGFSIGITAYIGGNAPTGTVTFMDAGSTIATASVSGGSARVNITLMGAGTHNLTASYGGDAANAPSTSDVFAMSVTAANSSTVLSATPDAAGVGAPVYFAAAISGALPTGTVTFSEGSTVLGTVPVTAGQATLKTSFATGGTHAISAAYSGDASNTASSSNVYNIEIGNVSSPGAPGPMTWQYGYDALGNPTSMKDPNGNLTTRTYDNAQRPASIVSPPPSPGASAPVVTLIHDDGLDHPSRVIDPRQLTTSYAIDGLGNTRTLTSPDTGVSTATFDAAGNMTSRTDARGKTAIYGYDDLSRLVSISYPTGSGTIFEYDGGSSGAPNAKGRLTKITDESGVTTYTFDPFGHVLTKTQQVGTGGAAKTFTVRYVWGVTGTETDKLVGIVYPSGSRVNYSYDAAGRPLAFTVNPVNANGIGTNTGSTQTVLTGVSYTATSDVSSWNWANGTVYRRTYDSFGRLLTYPLGNPSGSGAAQGATRTLTYDSAGQILNYTHAAQSSLDHGFTYDDAGRLSDAALAGTFYGYGLNANGNRTHRLIGPTDLQNTVDAASNRWTQVQSYGSSGLVTNAYTYDAAGNLTGDGYTTYTYSDRGRMSSATVSSGMVTYRYNGLEQRVSKTGTPVASGAAYFVYDEQGQLLGEYDVNRNPIYETIYLGSMPVAVMKQTGSAAASTLQVTTSNAYPDHLNTVRMITRGSDEAILWRWDVAEPFGATPPTDNPSGLGVYTFNQRFPGQIFDQETGNFDNWHRTYVPSLGGYVQPDPIGLDGGQASLYPYVGGNPLRGVDPYGLFDITNPADWPLLPQGLVDYAEGYGSYFGGLKNAGVHLYRRIGLSGKCLKQRAIENEAALGGALLSLSNPKIAAAAGAAAKNWASTHKAYIGGRFSAGIVTSGVLQVGPYGGASLGTVAAMGDALNNIDRGGDQAEHVLRGILGDKMPDLPERTQCECQR